MIPKTICPWKNLSGSKEKGGCGDKRVGKDIRWRGGGRGWGGGGRGWRHMYYATGLPGWMRFGFGWPAPQMTAAWGAEPWAYGAPAPGPMPREQELQMLRDHAEALKAQLDQISAHIEELEKEA